MGFWANSKQRLRDYGKLLLSQHLSPGRVWLAIFLGCIVGCLPLTGLQLFLCIGIARLLGLNLPIMYGAANISIPPIVPFLGWASVQLGERLLHGRYLALGRADFTVAALPGLLKHFFVNWLLGGTLIGGAIGGGAGAIVFLLLRRRAKAATPATAAADPVAAAIGRASRRYDAAAPRYRYYARAKYRLDPCYRAICDRVAAGALVVDLGCGLGMLGLALLELGGGRRCFGVDWDADKLAAGRAALGSPPPTEGGLPMVELVQGDLRTVALPPCEVVTLVDVLHYYDAATQAAVLARAVATLRPGGLLLVRETDPARAGGARLTRLFERAMVRCGWNRGPQVYYRPLSELCASLASLGLMTAQVEVAGATHPGNVLLSGHKPGDSLQPLRPAGAALG